MNSIDSLSTQQILKKKPIYLLKGLGCTDDVFNFLHFDEQYCPIVIQWEKPLQNESIEAYALRLLPQIHDPEPILIGLSFGGFIANELAEHFENAKVIIISSAKNKSELPLIVYLGRYKYMLKLFNANHLKNYSFIQNIALKNFNPQHRTMIGKMFKNIDVEFNNWAFAHAVQWNKSSSPKHVKHIHGTADLLFPISRIKDPIKVQGGSHFMIVEKANEVSNQIQFALKELLKENQT